MQGFLAEGCLISEEVCLLSNYIMLVARFTDEQYTTINQSRAERFDPRVFVNWLQVEKCCERGLFIWLQCSDVSNMCVKKGNAKIGSGTKTEVTVVEGVIGKGLL